MNTTTCINPSLSYVLMNLTPSGAVGMIAIFSFLGVATWRLFDYLKSSDTWKRVVEKEQGKK